MSRTHRNIWQHEKPSTASKASYVATICTSILGLPALVSGFLFISMRGMHMSCIILCYFGDKRYEMVAHIQRTNCYAMIAVFVQRLQLGSFELHVTCTYSSVMKRICLKRVCHTMMNMFLKTGSQYVALPCDVTRCDATRRDAALRGACDDL